MGQKIRHRRDEGEGAILERAGYRSVHVFNRSEGASFQRRVRGSVIANAADDMGADKATHAVVAAILPSLSKAK